MSKDREREMNAQFKFTMYLLRAGNFEDVKIMVPGKFDEKYESRQESLHGVVFMHFLNLEESIFWSFICPEWHISVIMQRYGPY